MQSRYRPTAPRTSPCGATHAVATAPPFPHRRWWRRRLQLQRQPSSCTSSSSSSLLLPQGLQQRRLRRSSRRSCSCGRSPTARHWPTSTSAPPRPQLPPSDGTTTSSPRPSPSWCVSRAPPFHSEADLLCPWLRVCVPIVYFQFGVHIGRLAWTSI